MEATSPANTNPLAWLSLVLGVLAPLTCGATAPFALLFGYLALRRVHLSDGRLPGLRAARAGMVLGAVTAVLFLAGLFVVGLVQMRVRSEVTICSNNLRRIGFAVDLYHDQKEVGNYPPGTMPLADVAPDRRLSWMVSILPYMEADPTGTSQKGQALYDRFDRNRGWDVPENRAAMAGAPAWFACPVAPRNDPTLAYYVGLAGFGTDAPTLEKGDPRAGFFGYDRVINRDDVTRGTSETMMVTERVGALGPWAAGGPATVTGVDPQRQPYVPGQFGGLHPHGANVLFADGHVNFIPDSASPVVWEEQCRIHRSE
jgi:prepilin-type processing-associated H-X9-DG protein